MTTRQHVGAYCVLLLSMVAFLTLPKSAEGADPSAAPSPTPETVMVPAGDLISVQLQGDIGSRISNEGDTFAVVTIEDYYAKGKLVLPKGSVGYGVLTHIKRAGSWHAGGELNFTVKRLIAPDGTTLDAEVNGATADADKNSEHNGNEFGQYLLFGGLGIFTHRGNDILIKDRTLFHVAVSDSKIMPVVPYGAKPAPLNETLVTIHPNRPTADPAATAVPDASVTPTPLPSTSPAP